MKGQQLVYSPVSLWKNFDSISLPFETEVIKSEEVDGIVYEHIYFNGNSYEDGVSRIYGIFATFTLILHSRLLNFSRYSPLNINSSSIYRLEIKHYNVP